MKTKPLARRIRILLADDHEILRSGLRTMLSKEPGMQVVAEAGTGTEAVQLAQERKVDIVVMDIGMPGLNGIEATRQLLAVMPDIRVICLSMHDEKRLVTEMLRAGASGYLLKTSAARDLVNALHTVMSGETYLTPSILEQIMEQHVLGSQDDNKDKTIHLTAREQDVLNLIAEGCHTKLIADRLNISPKTVLAHRNSLMHKLNVDTTVALSRYALQQTSLPL